LGAATIDLLRERGEQVDELVDQRDQEVVLQHVLVGEAHPEEATAAALGGELADRGDEAEELGGVLRVGGVDLVAGAELDDLGDRGLSSGALDADQDALVGVEAAAQRDLGDLLGELDAGDDVIAEVDALRDHGAAEEALLHADLDVDRGLELADAARAGPLGVRVEREGGLDLARVG
jgi:hypothetical protein